MDKALAVVESPTLWTVVITVLLNAVPAFNEFIPSTLLPIVDAILVALIAYFHVGSVDRAYDSVVSPAAKAADGVKRQY